MAGRWLLHEAGTRTQQLAMVLLGVLFVVAKGDPATLAQVRFARGDLWILAAALSWVAYSVLQWRWPSALGTRQCLACITFVGLLGLLPFTALELALVPMPPYSGRAWLLVVLAAELPGFLSYQAYGLMLRELGATPRAVGAALILPSIHLATRQPAAGAAG